MFSRHGIERDPWRTAGMVALALLLSLAALAALGGARAAAQGQTPTGRQAGIYFNLSADNPLGGDVTPGALLLAAATAVCGLAAVFLIVVGLLLWRSRRQQPAVVWTPLAQPPPLAQHFPVACAPAARLFITSPLGSFPPLSIPTSGLTIGRTTDNQLAINDVKASRCHARIDFINGVWFVIDLGSVNGTLVNGVRVERRALRQDDRITIGQTTLTFQAMSQE